MYIQFKTKVEETSKQKSKTNTTCGTCGTHLKAKTKQTKTKHAVKEKTKKTENKNEKQKKNHDMRYVHLRFTMEAFTTNLW